ncbi:type II toxin-antitoxin system antitoxin HipB [Salinicola sp. MIT1003]|uniref:type II toxin-antitoxin system antitoxin HipB n=1 Tax=Salinicola sp. MIT1003 TaxID=1882734 RepID=UPI0008DE0D04|nr:type II toxin-antitoxin system antitoxin HipB [Salinicola sp. MIT1003]OHZ01196.1 XRE family transcriptional regulator [Salinicola sp. MIT1003]
MKITSPDMLARALKEARSRNGLTQKDVAAQVGIKQATVSAFENHPEKSRVETLFKLMAALGLELHVAERESGQSEQSWDQEW